MLRIAERYAQEALEYTQMAMLERQGVGHSRDRALYSAEEAVLALWNRRELIAPAQTAALETAYAMRPCQSKKRVSAMVNAALQVVKETREKP